MLSANDLCKKCYRSDHFIKDCYAKTYFDGNNIYFEELDELDELNELELNTITSFNCIYCNKEFETQKGATFHENMYCKRVFNTKSKNKSKDKCYRCGREGHYSSDCYASTHVKGYYLD